MRVQWERTLNPVVGLRALGRELAAQPPGGGRAPAPETGGPIPGQTWIVHDPNRPQPRKVTPGLPIAETRPPSDAIVLFDGKDLSQSVAVVRGGGVEEPKWKVESGYM